MKCEVLQNLSYQDSLLKGISVMGRSNVHRQLPWTCPHQDRLQ